MVERERRIDFGDGFTVTVKADDAEASVLETTEPPGLSPPVHICRKALGTRSGREMCRAVS